MNLNVTYDINFYDKYDYITFFSLWFLYAAAFFTRIINKKEQIIKCDLDNLLDTSCADIRAEMFVSIDQ